MYRIESQDNSSTNFPFRVMAELMNEDNQVTCTRTDTQLVTRRNSTFQFQFPQINLADSSNADNDFCSTDSCRSLRLFGKIQKKLSIKILDSLNNTLDSSFYFVDIPNATFSIKQRNDKLIIELGNVDTSTLRRLQVALLLDSKQDPSMVIWRSFPGDPTCTVYLDEMLTRGFIPKSVSVFYALEESDLLIYTQNLQHVEFNYASLLELPKTNDALNQLKENSNALLSFRNKLKSFTTSKLRLDVSGTIWGSAFHTTQPTLGDSMPTAGIDGGTDLAVQLGGIPLKVASLQSSQSGFLGGVNQRTFSLDLNKLRERLPSADANLPENLINDNKPKLVAPGGMQAAQKRIQDSRPSIPVIPSEPDLPNKKDANIELDNAKDSVDQVKRRAYVKADSLTQLAQQKEDSIKHLKYLVSSRKNRWMRGIEFLEEFSIGRVSPSYGKFSMHTQSLDGFNLGVKYKSTRLGIFSGSAVANTLNMNPNTLRSWEIRGVNLEKKISDETSISFSGLTATQNIQKMNANRINNVAQFGHYFVSSKSGLSSEFLASISTNDIERGERSTTIIDKNFDYAFSLNLGYSLHQIKTKIGLEVEKVSPNFFTAGNQFLRKSYTDAGFFVKGNYFKGALMVRAKLMRRIQTIQANTNRSIASEFEIKFRKNGFNLTSSYKPMSISGVYQVAEGQLQETFMMLNVFVLTAHYAMKMGDYRGQWTFAYFNTNSSSFGETANKSENVRAGFSLSKKRSLYGLNAGYNKTSGSQMIVNPEDLLSSNIWVFNFNIGAVSRYNITTNWIANADFNLMTGNRIDNSKDTQYQLGLGIDYRFKIFMAGFKSNYMTFSNQAAHSLISRLTFSISF